MKGLKVIQPGILSLIQDTGRIGQHHNGSTVGGPMDRNAFEWANRLCTNTLNTPVVEVTIGGLVFESTVRSYFAVTGASVPRKYQQKVCCWLESSCNQPGRSHRDRFYLDWHSLLFISARWLFHCARIWQLLHRGQRVDGWLRWQWWSIA